MSDENIDPVLQVPQSHAERERLTFPIEPLRTPWPGHERHGDDCSACTIGPWRCVCGGLIHDAADERACDRCQTPVACGARATSEEEHPLLTDIDRVPPPDPTMFSVPRTIDGVAGRVEDMSRRDYYTSALLANHAAALDELRARIDVVSERQTKPIPSPVPSCHPDMIRMVGLAMREVGATRYRCGRFELDLGADAAAAAAAPERTERDKAPQRDPREDAFAATGSIPVKIEDVRGGK